MLAEHDLVSLGLPIVQAVSKKIARRLGGHVTLDDLTAIGNLALIDVVRTFDPSRSSFASYAPTKLRFAILDALRRETRARSITARVNALLASERIAEARARLAEPEGPTTVEEDQAALTNLLEAHAAALAIGLLASPADRSLFLGTETPEELLQRAEQAQVLRGVIEHLPERERALLERHYYGGEAFEAIARDLGISKSWASRLHERAILAVRDAIVTKAIEP